MSDLHLTKDGHPIWGTDTLEHFNKSIEIFRGMKDVEAIIVTWDISDDGFFWTYQYADNMFTSLGIPTFCCPENHDSLKIMLKKCAFFITYLSYMRLTSYFLMIKWKM